MKSNFWLLLLFFIAQALCAQKGPQHTIDPGSGLKVIVPSNWYIDKTASTFTADSFPPSQRPSQVLVPQDGAEITISVPPRGIRTTEEWLSSDRISRNRGYEITHTTVSTASFGTIDVTQAKAQPTVLQGGIVIIRIFTLRDRPVKVAMVYRPNRIRTSEFEGLLSNFIRDLAY
jgi:hypothetical protein